MSYRKYIFGIPFVGISLISIANYQDVKKILSNLHDNLQNNLHQDPHDDPHQDHPHQDNHQNNLNNKVTEQSNSKHVRQSIKRLTNFWGY